MREFAVEVDAECVLEVRCLFDWSEGFSELFEFFIRDRGFREVGALFELR